jgi:NitT/TauT family transport system ATP-binding protein/nitrate/nitrite transport system substrate-binding protein
MSQGVAGAEATPIIAPLALGLNGPAITLAARLAVVAGGGRRADGLARLIAWRRQEGASPITLAVVFPFSTHNYLLRDWLAAAGIDPDRDVRLTVAPPPRMNELLAGGVVEGFCVTEPWGSAAAAIGAGRIVARGADLWPRTPDKVFAVTQAWAADRPDELQALLRAMLRAAAWADDAVNRAELAAMLAQRRYVGADVAVIEASLPDVIFAADGATAPQPIHAAWLLTQMARWSQIGDQVEIAAAARAVYRPDLHAAAQAALGLSEVSELESLEAFCEGGFRLAGLFPPK